MGSATKQFLFNAEYTKPTSIILVGVNTRLESPILNIKIRRFAEEESIKIFLVGFSSNLNFNFIHKNTVMDKQHILWLNVFIEGALLVTRINNAILGPVSYNIANNLAVIHQFDIFGYMLTNTRGQLSLLLGQPETYPTGVLTKFIVATLHHVEDDFWAFMKKVNGLKFPVKFYMEKFGSYLTESGYFFSTFTNIYGFSIRGTREEWKVIAALTEFIFPQYNKLNKLVPKFNNVTGRLQLFSGSFVFDNFCMRKERMGSIINNYYISDLLSRISPILTLCSKAYTVLNDYKIIITN
ncbi:MAG TPA: hypothetical protein PKD85_00180 [Saprospiraceae bacterium]|nr:hypothetical protein [Saprospiraceae bacterium]